MADKRQDVINNPKLRRLIERYRLPAKFVPFSYDEARTSDPTGFFRFGSDLCCYGSLSGAKVTPSMRTARDCKELIHHRSGDRIELPFDPDQVADNFLLERYPTRQNKAFMSGWVRSAYYYGIRPWLSVAGRSYLQRMYLAGWRNLQFPRWPVDTSVETLFEELLVIALHSHKSIPFIWFWPEGYSGCVTLTHDVETAAGRDHCDCLMDLDDSFGFKAAFQLIPKERYTLSDALLEKIRDRGFEVNVHDLNHDGTLFIQKAQFEQRAAAINHFGRQFGALGFRAGVMHRNLEWLHCLEFEYDMSVPTVAHLEPQRGGCCTVMPYLVGDILELPLTTTQDYALFHLLKEHSLEHWERQFEAILQRCGMVSVLVHPDYVLEPKEEWVFVQLLERLDNLRRERNLWAATPGEVNRWWRARSRMRLVEEAGGWRIHGEGAAGARVAYVSLVNGKLHYSLEPLCPTIANSFLSGKGFVSNMKNISHS